MCYAQKSIALKWSENDTQYIVVTMRLTSSFKYIIQNTFFSVLSQRLLQLLGGNNQEASYSTDLH